MPPKKDSPAPAKLKSGPKLKPAPQHGSVTPAQLAAASQRLAAMPPDPSDPGDSDDPAEPVEDQDFSQARPD